MLRYGVFTTITKVPSVHFLQSQTEWLGSLQTLKDLVHSQSCGNCTSTFVRNLVPIEAAGGQMTTKREVLQIVFVDTIVLKQHIQ